jgi:hypothetical protein
MAIEMSWHYDSHIISGWPALAGRRLVISSTTKVQSMGSIRQHCIAALSVAALMMAACGSASAQTAVPLMKVSSAGTVGVGIDPGSGIPWAKLAIAGGNGNSTGPYLQFTTSSDSYPLLQVLPYTHDNISLNFDS